MYILDTYLNCDGPMPACAARPKRSNSKASILWEVGLSKTKMAHTQATTALTTRSSARAGLSLCAWWVHRRGQYDMGVRGYLLISNSNLSTYLDELEGRLPGNGPTECILSMDDADDAATAASLSFSSLLAAVVFLPLLLIAPPLMVTASSLLGGDAPLPECGAANMVTKRCSPEGTSFNPYARTKPVDA